VRIPHELQGPILYFCALTSATASSWAVGEPGTGAEVGAGLRFLAVRPKNCERKKFSQRNHIPGAIHFLAPGKRGWPPSSSSLFRLSLAEILLALDQIISWWLNEGPKSVASSLEISSKSPVDGQQIKRRRKEG